MKISICYSTMTGHSKKIAKALGAEFEVTPVNVKNESPDLLYADVLVVVCGIYGGKLSDEMASYLKGIEKTGVSRAILVMSSTSGNYSKTGIEKIFEDKGIEIFDRTSVPASFLFMNFKRPNENDIKEAVGFVKDAVGRLEAIV